MNNHFKMVRNYKRKTTDKWTKEDLIEALTLIKESKMKINDAARQFGISRATLYRQYQKFITSGPVATLNEFRTSGGSPILSKTEEDVMEKTILDLRTQGFPVNCTDIKRICYEYCEANGIPNQFNREKRMASDDWYYGFLKRHDSLRTGRSFIASKSFSVSATKSPPLIIRRSKRQEEVNEDSYNETSDLRLEVETTEEYE